ncbi:MAG: hypothetical protein Q9227_007265 [Pyrenula ochraceoflavens]
MPIDRRKFNIIVAASSLRLILFSAFPSFADLLTGHVEVSTPVSSYKRLREGLFLYERGVSPYDGGVFHQAPLLLPIYSLLSSNESPTILVDLLYILLDALNAYALTTISESGQAVATRFFTSSRSKDQYSSSIVSASYLFNPFTVLACLGRSTSIFTNTAIIHAVSSAVQGNESNCMLALAIASYLSMYPILLLPPLLLLLWNRHRESDGSKSSGTLFITRLTATLISWLGALLGLSFLLTGSWAFIPATYGMLLSVPDLTPNIGLWWYFFVEMFDSFRDFFLGVFWLHIAIYVGGLTLRLHKQPLFVITSLLGLFGIFKPYPSISDISLYFAFLTLYKHLFSLMRYTFVSSTTLLYASLLGPAFYYLWIYAGSGNANFFYAITLVWSLGLSMLVADSVYAALRDEWEIERPEMKGKEARRI